MYPTVRLELPEWIGDVAPPDAVFADDDARVGLAVMLSRENVERGVCGPFGAAVFESATGRLVAPGVNLVTRLGVSSFHAEIVALSVAQARAGSHALPAGYVLACSCEPCAMCLGAALWSGVSRVVWGALGDDARALGFDEGPVFRESHEYLEARGVSLSGGVRRDEARAVLRRYADCGGQIYNPR